MKVWLVRMANKVVIVTAAGREGAKGQAYLWMGGDKDTYTVEPLTRNGDQIHFSVTTYV